jgi:DNA (cytosine-5)-methyltransferase 1
MVGRRLTHGSLFAGIGGFDLGFERAGIKTVWQVEIDEYCRRVLEKHFPEAERFAEIRDCGARNLSRVDVLSGGFPCQDISDCGLRAGLSGDRSGLWREMARIIGEIRPRFVCVENVSALLERGMGDVLADLANFGYDAEWECLPAAAFGAPHVRERIWIVAYPESKSRIHKSGNGHIRNIFDGSSLRAFKYSHKNVPAPYPELCRVDDGIPNRVDRHEHLGNALYPQIAQWIAERILEAEGLTEKHEERNKK